MQEMLWGLLGVLVGLLLWHGGALFGGKEQEPTPPRDAVTLPPEEQAAVQKALRERYNFLNFEGDEMRGE